MGMEGQGSKGTTTRINERMTVRGLRWRAEGPGCYRKLMLVNSHYRVRFVGFDVRPNRIAGDMIMGCSALPRGDLRTMHRNNGGHQNDRHVEEDDVFRLLPPEQTR